MVVVARSDGLRDMAAAGVAETSTVRHAESASGLLPLQNDNSMKSMQRQSAGIVYVTRYWRAKHEHPCNQRQDPRVPQRLRCPR